MNELLELVKTQNDAYARAYNQGHHDGYVKGFKDAMEETKRNLAEALAAETKLILEGA